MSEYWTRFLKCGELYPEMRWMEKGSTADPSATWPHHNTSIFKSSSDIPIGGAEVASEYKDDSLNRCYSGLILHKYL